MRLNGWQRLWVVAATVWAVPVFLVSYIDWPSAANVSDAEVNEHLSPADVSALLEGFAAEAGWVPVTTDPSWALSKHRPPDLDAAGHPVLTVVHVESHSLRFTSNTSKDEMNRIAGDFSTSLRTVLRVRRATFASEALAAWIIPTAVLYALGWSVGWVRRGFKQWPPSNSD